VQWTGFPPPTEPPAAVPIVLAATAGFVDACTFLGLFGFFVAQVTGSYVLVGARPVVGWPGLVAVLAVPAFSAGGVAATIAAILGHAVARRPLAAALTLETLLLIGFAATFASAPSGMADASAVAASLLGLAAMGVQSATVRLLMRGAASTNVMTTNTTQVTIDATQLAWSWLCGKGGAAEAARQREAARRLWNAVPLPIAFLLGTLLGAAGFSWIGRPVLAVPVIVTGTLAWWATQWGTVREDVP
jgi:uncharacterized membrane protein YoaK (UPF0700 family)